MKDDKIKHLAETLTTLTNEEKAWVINFLVQGMIGTPVPKRKAKHSHRNILTDEQWEEYFGHKPAIPFPEETTPLEEMRCYTSGKTIKQMEKWL